VSSYRVIPGLLSGQHIECNDAAHHLRVNLLLVPLSPIQYQLVKALLSQRQRWEAELGQVPFLVSVSELQRVAGLRRRKDVKKQLWHANGQLGRQALRAVSVHGYGYALFSLSELQPPVALIGAAVPPGVEAGESG